MPLFSYFCTSLYQPIKKFKTSINLFVVFEAIAVSLWLSTGSLFYLFNFTYIGTILELGLALSRAGWKHDREFILCQKCKKECPVKTLR